MMKPHDIEQDSTDQNLAAKRLAALRKMLGLSQRQLAREFNVTPGAIANWEAGTRPVNGAALRLLEIYEENLGMTDRPTQTINKINADWASRTLRSGMTSARLISRLAGVGLKQMVAGNERAAQIKTATDQAIAREVIESLGELKGLMMKFGQMMVYMNFALPKNVRILLESLQDNSKPMSQDAITSVFQHSFGKPPERVFAKWEKFPFAAASIGQVHRAELPDGTKVAVKIQYPEIVRALQSDLKNVAIIENLSGIMFRYQDKGAFVAELKERVLEECDYQIEAENGATFRSLFENNPNIVIPRTFPEFSSKTVLTSEFMEGLRFREFLDQASQEQKNLAGKIMFEFTFRSIFEHGIFNCDPNGGNFLFCDGKVAFIDFGCVKRFNPQFIDEWKQLSCAALLDNKERVIELGSHFGHTPRADLIDLDYQYQSLKMLYEPWLLDRDYTFTSDYVERTWRQFVANNPDKYRLALPKDWIFTNRLQWGLCALLGELNATANWHRIWREVTEFEKYRR